MRLFKRRGPGGETDAPPAGAGGRGSPIAEAAEHDWRSYDGVAESYARVLAPRMAIPARDLVAFVGVTRGGRVLDVGTGTGVGARAAAEVVGEEGVVVGIDPSVEMLRQAMAGQPDGARYAAATAIDLPFRDGAFGFVLSTFVLSHFARYDTALFDMLRVLRTGGRIGVAVWGPGEDEFTRAWTEVAEQFAEHEILQDARSRAMPWADLFSNASGLKDALHQAGLRDIQIDRREYRFEMDAQDYIESRETVATGRFLRQMLGPDFWETFRERTREVFADRFPQRFNDFREVILAIGHKP